MIFAEALVGGGIAGLPGVEEFFGLRLELFKTRTRRERFGHITFVPRPEVRRQAASRLMISLSKFE